MLSNQRKTRLLLAILLIILTFLLIAGIAVAGISVIPRVEIPTPTIPPSPTPIPTPYVVSSSKISDLEIRTTYPAEMELHRAYPIEMSLKPKNGISSVSSLQAIYALIPASNPTTNVAPATPVGTPNTTIKNAFSKGYEPFATATFYAGTFAVQPSMPQEQSLDQPEVSWRWNVTPQETGVQVMSGEIRIDWKSINQGSAATFSFIVGNPQIIVRVKGSFDWSPWIASGLTVLSGVTLALLSWLGTQIWSQISKRRKNTKENGATKTPNEPPSNNIDPSSKASPS